MKKINRKQWGLSLVELMVGILMGMIIISGATSVFISTLSSSSTTLKMSKLNQELSTIMSIMASDIRRAGYNFAADANAPHNNEFNQVGDTALSLRTSVANPTTNPGVLGNGECLLYTYDQDKDGVVDNSEFFGFRVNNDILEMRQIIANAAAIVADTAEDSCTNGTWGEVTDGELIDITTLTFSLANANCLNISMQDGLDNDTDGAIDEDDEINCYTSAPVSPATTVEVRVLEITLAGELVSDPLVKSTLSHAVRVRNDLIRIY